MSHIICGTISCRDVVDPLQGSRSSDFTSRNFKVMSFSCTPEHSASHNHNQPSGLFSVIRSMLPTATKAPHLRPLWFYHSPTRTMQIVRNTIYGQIYLLFCENIWGKALVSFDTHSIVIQHIVKNIIYDTSQFLCDWRRKNTNKLSTKTEILCLLETHTPHAGKSTNFRRTPTHKMSNTVLRFRCLKERPKCH